MNYCLQLSVSGPRNFNDPGDVTTINENIHCIDARFILLCWILLWLWYRSTLPISFKVTSLALGQSYDCPIASEQCLITNASQPAMGRGVSPGARMATTTIWPSRHQSDLMRVRGPERVCVLSSDSSQRQYACLWWAKPKDPRGEDIQGKITLMMLSHWKMWVRTSLP